jgi:uncharacterized protein
MKVLVSGASGLVGSSTVLSLREAGHDVRVLIRKSNAAAPGLSWDQESGALDIAGLKTWAGPDAVIHLAGENIASGRWTPERKKRIRDSRVNVTERLASSLVAMEKRPNVFISASAIGYYGDRGEEVLTETSRPGNDFLAKVVVDWESSVNQLTNAGIRVVLLRFGMILSANGGALKKMLPIFNLGLGGPVGNGRQWISWISIHDAVRLIRFALESIKIRGAYNAVSPYPLRNADFGKELGAVLHRPAILRTPAWALKLAFGEMAEALLLTSQRVTPERLKETEFRFQHEHLPTALEEELR